MAGKHQGVFIIMAMADAFPSCFLYFGIFGPYAFLNRASLGSWVVFRDPFMFESFSVFASLASLSFRLVLFGPVWLG
jgi:hypothetical protein